MREKPVRDRAPSGLSKDLVAASAVPLILAILTEAESYGYAIIKRIREVSGGMIKWSEGMLYPVLHRLEAGGHVQAYWESAESGRKRKYYRVTPTGVEELRRRTAEWSTVNMAIERLGGRRNDV